MLFSPHDVDGIFPLFIYAGISFLPFILTVFGAHLVKERKGWISAILFFVGISIGIGSTIWEISVRIWYTHSRLDLPWVYIFIGLALVVLSLVIPTQKKQEDNGEEEQDSRGDDL